MYPVQRRTIETGIPRLLVAVNLRDLLGRRLRVEEVQELTAAVRLVRDVLDRMRRADGQLETRRRVSTHTNGNLARKGGAAIGKGAPLTPPVAVARNEVDTCQHHTTTLQPSRLWERSRKVVCVQRLG
jgi:hypothetical protein